MTSGDSMGVSTPKGWGKSEWTRMARELILPRYANPQNYRKTTLRAIWYLLRARLTREHVARAATGRAPGAPLSYQDPHLPSRQAFLELAQRIEAETGRPLEEAGIYRGSRGAVFIGGQEFGADRRGLGMLDGSSAVVIVEKEGVSQVLGEELADTRIGILSTQGSWTKDKVETVERLRAAKVPILFLSDFDPAGEVMGQRAEKLGVKRVSYQELKAQAERMGRGWDVKELAEPELGDPRTLVKSLAPERARLFEDLGALAGFPKRMDPRTGAEVQMAGKVELDSILGAMGPDAMARAVLGLLPEEAARPPDPGREIRELARALALLMERLRRAPRPGVIRWLRVAVDSALRELSGPAPSSPVQRIGGER